MSNTVPQYYRLFEWENGDKSFGIGNSLSLRQTRLGLNVVLRSHACHPLTMHNRRFFVQRFVWHDAGCIMWPAARTGAVICTRLWKWRMSFGQPRAVIWTWWTGTPNNGGIEGKNVSSNFHAKIAINFRSNAEHLDSKSYESGSEGNLSARTPFFFGGEPSNVLFSAFPLINPLLPMFSGPSIATHWCWIRHWLAASSVLLLWFTGHHRYLKYRKVTIIPFFLLKSNIHQRFLVRSIPLMVQVDEDWPQFVQGEDRFRSSERFRWLYQTDGWEGYQEPGLGRCH